MLDACFLLGVRLAPKSLVILLSQPNRYTVLLTITELKSYLLRECREHIYHFPILD